jgi:hypothetical protein
MVRRAKAAWLLGFFVVLAGFLAVLLFVLQAFLPGALLLRDGEGARRCKPSRDML